MSKPLAPCLWTMFFAAGVAWTGCTAEEIAASNAGTDITVTSEDTSAPVLDNGTPLDTSTPQDADETPDAAMVTCPEPGGWGCDCLTNEDCNSGWCVPGPDGDQCTKNCDADCPDGWLCKAVSDTSGDPSFICVALHTHLCRPCETGADCEQLGGTGGYCILGDNGAFCGGICGDDVPCPEGYSCEWMDIPGVDSPVQQCRPVADAECTCNAIATKEAASTPCEQTNEFGSCPGVRSCGSEGLSACTGSTPEEELCDGIDNDCDGETDEDLGTTTCGVGFCTTTVTACENGEANPCNPLFIPGEVAEMCDGIDNDCDGETDEESGSPVCGVGACAHTIEGCVDGVPGLCEPFVGATDEVCDGLDNDCDGETDEEIPAVSCGVGACTHEVSGCVAGAPEACDPLAGVTDEVCDGIDNDCDGETDEEIYALDNSTCGLVGVCADPFSYVTASCEIDAETGETTWECDYQSVLNHQNGDEIGLCDGLDNDCDGEIDEDHPVGEACDGPDEDQCLNGVFACDPESPDQVLCQELPVDFTVEVCDGADNDCDGQTDEGESFALKGTPCDGADDDQCNFGSWTCTPDGQGLECVNESIQNIPDVCDGEDNDCDGETDEGHGDISCGDGVCAKTLPACVNGVSQACDPFAEATPEICDGLDNDCDGDADEALGTTSCGLGVCTHTVDNCLDGATQICDPLEGASDEVCDGDDNDCDGETDEEQGITTCGLGTCVHTVDNCVGGLSQTCDPLEGSAPEVCDGLDNDCDGEVDQGFADSDEDGDADCIDEDDDGDGDPDISDCAPLNPEIHAGATELCDGLDSNCDGAPELLDDFDGDTLEAGWALVCTGDAPTFTLEDGALVITDSPFAATPSTPDQSWIYDPTVDLGNQICRSFPAGDDDFDVVFTLQWDSDLPQLTLAGVGLTNASNQLEIYSGMLDGYSLGPGSPFATIRKPDADKHPSASTDCNNPDYFLAGQVDPDDCEQQPQAGDATFRIQRVSGQVTVYVDDTPILEAPVDADIQKLAIFHVSHQSADISYEFGTVAMGSLRWCGGACVPTDEVCDGQDNNCDGEFDEGFPDTDGDHLADCVDPDDDNDGDPDLTDCAPDNPAVLNGGIDLCNGVDDDCDPGTLDGAHDPGLGLGCDGPDPDLCLEGALVCDATGSLSCDDETGNTIELCNGLDDDCDGGIDETFSNGEIVYDGGPLGADVGGGLGDPCGAGACQGGVVVCGTDQSSLTCSSLDQITTETCDSQDNDCDGTADEDFVDGTVTYGGGPLAADADKVLGETCGAGECQNGTVVCGADGVSLTCDNLVLATAEICDGIDNDCDGAADESPDSPEQPLEQGCYSGAANTQDVGLCSSGTQACVAGVFGPCQGEILPVNEVCDGLDNDCDGEADGAGTLGDSPECPAPHCRAIKEARPGAPDGNYWIQVGNDVPIEVECDLMTAGGGWTRLVHDGPASTHPSWTDAAGYNSLGDASHISRAWHQLSDFTEVMTQNANHGGSITACWSQETMAAQVAKGAFTCNPAAIAGLSHESTLQFNPNTSHAGCGGLSANIAYGFVVWDGGVSGAWSPRLASNGYKTNNTVNCGTSCVKYSNGCLPASFNGGHGSFWVR